jgi:hypothetical protein
MSIKQSLFTGSVVAVLVAGAFFKVGQATRRKSKAEQAAEQSLRILSGANGVEHVHNNGSAGPQSRQANQLSTSAVSSFGRPRVAAAVERPIISTNQREAALADCQY